MLLYCKKCYSDNKCPPFPLPSEYLYNVLDSEGVEGNPTRIVFVCKGCQETKNQIVSEEITRKFCEYYWKDEKTGKFGLTTMYNGKGSSWTGTIIKKLKDIPYKYLSEENFL